MPELPEVETVVRGLARQVTGRRIREVQVLHRPSVAGSPANPNTAAGHTIERVWRRGKFIRIELSGNMAIAVHLRMTGWLGAQSAKTPLDAYVRVVLPLEGAHDNLVFHDIRTFGRMWFGHTQQLASLPALTKLGPEPLEIEAVDFVKRLKAHSGRIKSLLLNQEFLAGVGNIYADESLHAAKIHPLEEGHRISKPRARALHAAIQDVLHSSILAGGTSIENFRDTEGQPGWFQRELLVYGRAGQPCTSCKTVIRRTVLGQRGTWFCPSCQRRR